jgi:hypothetical protein
VSANDNSGFFLDTALGEITAAKDVAIAKIERLLREVFDDGDRAVRSYAALIKTRGPEETIRILGSDGTFGRHWHFGWMKGGWLAAGKRTAALACLRELPEAITTHAQLVARTADLVRADRTAADRQRAQTPLPDILQSRGRKLH